MNEAELLFTEVLGCDRISLYLDAGRPLSLNQFRTVARALKRRISGEPIQYILGKAEFMGIMLKVNKSVLIPRPETEILAQTVIKYAQECPARGKKNILDLCTGSGCVALSINRYIPHARVDAVDISEEAIGVAKKNALAHNLKVNFIKSDLFSNSELSGKKYDIIVANPPYVASLEISTLSREVRCEPRIALDGGDDGLKFYRRVIGSACPYLNDMGFLIMEMGFGQKESIEAIARETGMFALVNVLKDYNDIERVMVLRKVLSDSAN